MPYSLGRSPIHKYPNYSPVEDKNLSPSGWLLRNLSRRVRPILFQFILLSLHKRNGKPQVHLNCQEMAAG